MREKNMVKPTPGDISGDAIGITEEQWVGTGAVIEGFNGVSPGGEAVTFGIKGG